MNSTKTTNRLAHCAEALGSIRAGEPNTRTFHQTLIRAGQSLNGNIYSADLLERCAQKFNSANTYANHHYDEKRGRSIRDLTGWITDARFEAGEIVGTRHFVDTQAGQDAYALISAIVEGKAPQSLMGASVDIWVEQEETADGVVVTDIVEVESVDDVARPAAGGGFRPQEAQTDDGLVQMVIGRVSYEQWMSNERHAQRLRQELKAARQTEALKTASAESERLRVELSQANHALQERTQALQALLQAREQQDTALGEYRKRERLNTLLAQAMISTALRATLSAELEQLPESEWPNALQRFKRLANAQRAMSPETATYSSPRQEATPIVLKTPFNPLPEPTENVRDWMKRLELKR